MKSQIKTHKAIHIFTYIFVFFYLSQLSFIIFNPTNNKYVYAYVGSISKIIKAITYIIILTTLLKRSSILSAQKKSTTKEKRFSIITLILIFIVYILDVSNIIWWTVVLGLFIISPQDISNKYQSYVMLLVFMLFPNFNRSFIIPVPENSLYIIECISLLLLFRFMPNSEPHINNKPNILYMPSTLLLFIIFAILHSQNLNLKILSILENIFDVNSNKLTKLSISYFFPLYLEYKHNIYILKNIFSLKSYFNIFHILINYICMILCIYYIIKLFLQRCYQLYNMLIKSN